MFQKTNATENSTRLIPCQHFKSNIFYKFLILFLISALLLFPPFYEKLLQVVLKTRK